MKLEALQCIRTTIEVLPFNLVAPSIQSLLPIVLLMVKADWYKVISEGLRVLNAIVLKYPSGEISQVHLIMNDIYLSVLPRLEALDIDVEIKVCLGHELHCPMLR